ncbi:MAG: nuclear transport factor 2 family protein [Vicinamibacteria bacterium]
MAALLVSQPGAASEEATKELLAIEHGLANAWVSKDRVFIAGVLADEWAVVDAAGDVRTKQEVLKEFDSGDLRLDAAKVENVEVRQFGDVAVVRGRSNSTGAYKGVSMTVALRFTDVFVKKDGRWLCIASHATQLPP